MLHRPERFSEIIGHKKQLMFIQERINQGNFPQFTLFYSEEGLGKTTMTKLIALALSCESMVKPCYECESCRNITQKVIRENQDTVNVKTFKMSVEGGKDAAKEVLASLNTAFLDDGKPKVIILEECHAMSDAAQDALLTDTEYLPSNVYVMMATTNILRLTKTLLSRAVQFNLSRLTNAEMRQLLKLEASRRGLDIQYGNAALDLIISWSENKPRRALNALKAMGENTQVTMDMVKDYVDFLNISEVIPIIRSFSGSLVIGLHSVMELPLSQSAHLSLMEILVEAVKVSYGEKTFKLTNEDYALLRDAVQDIPRESLILFLHDIAAVKELTRGYLIASFLKVHPDNNKLIEGKRETVLNDELTFKQENFASEEIQRPREDVTTKAPTFEALLKRGKLLE